MTMVIFVKNKKDISVKIMWIIKLTNTPRHPFKELSLTLSIPRLIFISGTDPHKFPPFYGNRSYFSLKNKLSSLENGLDIFLFFSISRHYKCTVCTICQLSPIFWVLYFQESDISFYLHGAWAFFRTFPGILCVCSRGKMFFEFRLKDSISL